MGIPSNKNHYFIKLCLVILVTLLLIQIIPNEFLPVKKAIAETSWKQDSKVDFKNGISENITILNSGEIILKKQTKNIEDNFVNNFNISSLKNLKLNPIQDKIELIKKIGNFDGGYYIDNTSDGGYIIVDSTTSYGAGGYDVLLIKADKNLNEQWKKTFGSPSSEFGYCVQETSDDGFIIVGSKYTEITNVWIIKTDSSGNEQWNRLFKNGIGYSVQQTKDKGFIIGGSTQGLGGSWGGWLIKTDSSGVEQWNKTYGGFEHDHIYSVLPISDNGFIAMGLSNSYGGEDDDIWVIKTDEFGKILWNRTFGGNSNDQGFSLIETTNGGYLISGRTNSYAKFSEDIWLIMITSQGVEQWNKTFDVTIGRYEIGRCVIETNDNQFIIVGDSESKPGDDSDVVLIKTDSLGNLKWKKILGGNDADRGYSILKDSESGYIIIVSISNPQLINIDDNGNIKFVYGEIISKNLLFGENVASINKFRYETYLPIDSIIKIQFSIDNKSWCNADGNLNLWTTLDNGKNTIDISNLKWQGSSFFYKINFTSRNQSSPNLQFIEIEIDKYYNIGSFESQSLDSGGNLTWLKLDWESQTPKGTTIKSQLRSAKNKTELLSKQFVGPNGEITSYYEISGTDIWHGHNNDSWIQFKIYLLTNNTAKTPILKNVTITFDYYPNIYDVQVTPKSGNITDIFNFTVNYVDKDNDPPIYLFICIDGINYSMNEHNILNNNVSDGKKYWYSIKLKAGNHTYQFFTSDKYHNCSTKLQKLEIDFGPLEHIVVEPSSAKINVQEYQIFLAKGFDADDNYIPISPIWYVTGGGTIDQLGNFSSTTPGIWIIYANSSGISGNASITVINVEDDNKTDSDNDKIPDYWEQKYGLNITNSTDAKLDFDKDNLTNLEEYLNRTNPFDPDTDNDNYNDGLEIDKDTDPLDDEDYPSEEDEDKEKEFDGIDYTKYVALIGIIIFILISLTLYVNLKKKKEKG